MKHGNSKPSPHVARRLKYPPTRGLHSVSIAAAAADAPATRMHAHTMTCNWPHHSATQKELLSYASSCNSKQQRYWYRQVHRPANRCPRMLQQAMPQKPATNRTLSLPLRTTATATTTGKHNQYPTQHSCTHRLYEVRLRRILAGDVQARFGPGRRCKC